MPFANVSLSQVLRGVLIGLCCGAACWWVSTWQVVRGLEDQALDKAFVLREPREGVTDVVIVALDEEAFASKPLMHSSPELTEVIEYVRLRGARAIGLDILVLDDKHDRAELARGAVGDAFTMGDVVLESAGCPVVLPELLSADSKPLFPLRQWWLPPEVHAYVDTIGDGVLMGVERSWHALAFVNSTPDADMYMRRQKLRQVDSLGTRYEPSFALAVYGAAQGLDARVLDELVLPKPGARFGEARDLPIPLDRGEHLRINYRGPAGTIPSVPLSEVLEAARGETDGEQDWQGKIVLIGDTSRSSPDLHATPFISQSVLRLIWPTASPRLMPGVEVHANVIATLGDRAFIVTPWYLSTPLLLMIAGPLLGVLYVHLNLVQSLLVAFIHHWLWKGFCYGLFAWQSWRVECIGMSLLGVMVPAVVFGLRWHWIRRLAGMLKTKAIVDAMVRDPHLLERGGDERVITVMFCDVRGFTSFSEGHSSTETAGLLNDYFSIVEPVIQKHGGVLNQFVGDGMQALFGAPVPLPGHARKALMAAIEMIRQVEAHRSTWARHGAPEFRIGVGIHTGPVFIGAVGSEKRLDFVAIGDTTNTAARIEAANKALGTDILISQATLDALPVPNDLEVYLCEPRQVELKGKKQPLDVYPVDASADSLQQQETEVVETLTDSRQFKSTLIDPSESDNSEKASKSTPHETKPS